MALTSATSPKIAGSSTPEFRKGSGLKLYNYAEKEISIEHPAAENFVSTITRRTVIPASEGPTEVIFRSSVSPSTPRTPSAGYIAVMRRRHGQAISSQIASLATKVARDDFSACTMPIVKAIGDAIEGIGHTEAEGNAREILRRVRDTFFNGGWNRYREESVRSAAIMTLAPLVEGIVTTSDANAAFTRLSNVGSNPAGISLFAYDDEEEGT